MIPQGAVVAHNNVFSFIHPYNKYLDCEKRPTKRQYISHAIVAVLQPGKVKS